MESATELVKVEVRLSPTDRARLAAIAAAWGVSVSRAVARMLDKTDRTEFYGRAAALVGDQQSAAAK